MWRTFTILFAAGAGLAAECVAQSERAEPLRLSAVIEEARQQNPELQAARERSKAVAATPKQVSAYDDPMFTYEGFNIPESLNLARTDNNILKLSQKVPFPGKRTLAGTIAERDAEMARREVDGVELDVIAAVKRAYYDLWLVHQNLLIYSRDKELVQRFARITEQKYAVGQVSQPDVLRAQVELTRLINRVTTQTFAVDGARAELNALLSRTPDEALGIPEEPAAPRLEETSEQLTDLALRQRPELGAQTSVIARQESSLRLARLNYLPDFEFTVERFLNAGRQNGFGAIASISLPFAYKSKYDAGVAEASARLASARAELRRLQDRVRREVKQAFVRARTALEQRDLFVTTHIPQAEQALQATEIGYQTGKVDFLSLIDSVRAIESVHLEHIQAAAEFEKAYADLGRAVGSDLPHGKTE